MMEKLSYRMESDKAFDTVVANLEKETAGSSFKVLYVHDVHKTLKEKGFESPPLKIIEVCNAGFAHEALRKQIDVALFMPCKFVVRSEGTKTVVTLARPKMISDMMPQAGLDELAADVEATLKRVMQASV